MILLQKYKTKWRQGSGVLYKSVTLRRHKGAVADKGLVFELPRAVGR